MDALRASSALYDANPGARDGFVRHVLVMLDWRHNLAWGPDAAAFAVAVPEHQTSVDVSFAMLAQDDAGVVAPGAALLLGMVLPPKTATTGRAPAGSGTWTAGPADRLAHALRVRGVPLGLVTNGDTWTLVCVSEGGAVSTATWTRHAWLEEPQTLRAFVALLTRARFLGVAADQTLPALLQASLARQEEVTERLAEQSQAVVEMLVATLGRLDATYLAEHGTRLLPAGVGPAEVYQASVTVLMRLVFLLYAEERGLLPLDDDTYAGAYAVTTLAAGLRERATDHGEDALERTATGWYRLLSLFRGVHRGARHEQLILAAYGGSLFDPDRFPWLEGRDSATEELSGTRVPAINDRTLLRALDALQTLQFAKERRRVSYRSLDVEQIGYVYEGLLDQDARTAEDWVVSIAVSDKDLRKNGPEVFLTDLEAQQSKGEEALAAWLVEQIKAAGGNRSKASILKALTPPAGEDAQRYARLVREACGNDDSATARVMPYCRLLRMDPRDLPVVYPPGSLYLTDSSARANTGAVYTPRFLAEQVVETTLEALVYKPGPLDTEDKTAWVLRTPEEILDLKICDIAAGSGAFLVAATRYLADRLLEANRLHSSRASESEPDDDDLISVSLGARELEEQELLDARRAVIDHCIYGVDINPMAVEMAKLSLWLVTLDPGRPFSFLDDRLATGDSLLGITNPDQLRDLQFDPKRGRALHTDAFEFFTADTDTLLKAASELRKEIAEIDLRDTRDAEHKQRLLHRANELTARLTLVADGLTGASLAGGTEAHYLHLANLVRPITEGDAVAEQALLKVIQEWLGSRVSGKRHRPAHYPLLFPEIFTDGRDGFDAIIGNPPYLGGSKLSGAFGGDYREFLVRVVGAGERGTADLIAYMMRQALMLASRSGGQVGLIGTNSLAQGDTRDVALSAAIDRGLDIRAAVKSNPWPTAGATLEYCVIWGSWKSRAPKVHAWLDGRAVLAISPSLDEEGRVGGQPYRLARLKGVAFTGSKVYGDGFVLTREEGEDLLSRDPRNWEVVRPYLIGEDLNASPKGDATRMVVDFRDWTLERAGAFPEALRILEERVKPIRIAMTNNPQAAKNWWLFERRRPELYLKLGELDRAIAMALVGRVVRPAFVTANQVFSNALAVFASDDPGLFAFLSSEIHHSWAWKWAGTMRADLRYAPSDVYETLPQPKELSSLKTLGEELHASRLAAMSSAGIGLTKTYNLVNSPGVADIDIDTVRRLHCSIDEAVCLAYGWEDLIPGLAHAHYETRQGVRWTISPAIQTEILDRLLQLNHDLYAAEVATGLHDNAKKKPPRAPTKRAVEDEATLFGEEA